MCGGQLVAHSNHKLFVCTAMQYNHTMWYFTCAQKLTNSQLDAAYRTENLQKVGLLKRTSSTSVNTVLSMPEWSIFKTNETVTARIQFKIALLTFKTLTTHQPSYIHDLLQPHCSSRQLRSASHNLLEIPRMRTGFAQRSFTYSAPHIWNSLTGNVDVTANTFKKKLKTFYYTNCYP